MDHVTSIQDDVFVKTNFMAGDVISVSLGTVMLRRGVNRVIVTPQDLGGQCVTAAVGSASVM